MMREDHAELFTLLLILYLRKRAVEIWLDIMFGDPTAPEPLGILHAKDVTITILPARGE